ncbi:hypothetical protein AB0L53_23180 [Nonomuraea sp. NPDC052129]|uniref:hypothetical protein n=1 Tax=Nonomuraea sp. NPDC052129 TaxID=3154651 RepID=UPI0034322757
MTTVVPSVSFRLAGLPLPALPTTADAPHTPFWEWLADILDIVLMIALLPLALAVLDVYETIRGLVS